jgi:hypothetical protein
MSTQTLINQIDDQPDLLHVDITPAVLKLVDLGLAGLQAVLDLLDAPNLLTRKRAQRVVEGVIMQRHGWVAGQGYTTPDGQEKTQALLNANGDYQADAASETRRASIEKWRRWLESQQK